MTERIDNLKPTVFLDGPSEYLVKTLAALLAAETHWKQIFGEAVDGYKRMDYGIRNLPALRVYSNGFTKEHESWFMVGDIVLDLIMPPSLRRNELQQAQDTLASALIQQFRRPSFFAAIEAAVPGLNELGKRMTVDKSMGFEWGEEYVPLTQISVNFRLDLRQWDRYLEDESRTKDDPFDVTLAALTAIGTTIEGLKLATDETSEVEVSIDQEIGGEE